LALGCSVFCLSPAVSVWAAPHTSASTPHPAAAPAGAKAPSQRADGTDGIDSLTTHKLYMDGDFDPAIAMLESDLQSRKLLSHDDSVFIFKHLGVMYAANYETRERGKMYMHQLLMTEPGAKIMDMYASDMIYMIFKNIQDEFETNRARLSNADSSEHPRPGPDKPKSGSHLGLWIGAAVLAAGAGTYLLILSLSGGSRNHSL
jgi:hypothetical protein